MEELNILMNPQTNYLDSLSFYQSDNYDYIDNYENLILSSDVLDDDTIKSNDFQQFELLNNFDNEATNYLTNTIVNKTEFLECYNYNYEEINNSFSKIIQPSSNFIDIGLSKTESFHQHKIDSNNKRKLSMLNGELSDNETDQSFETENSDDSSFYENRDENKRKKEKLDYYSVNDKSLSYNKKQSNKEAAIRYRQKKQKEKENLFHTRSLLEKENQELKSKIEDIQVEINFVKNILVEMLFKKNLFSNTS